MSKITSFAIVCLFSFIVLGCSKTEELPDSVPGEHLDSFSVDDHHILKDGLPFDVKGVVYVPGYPGQLPWEIENSVTLNQNLKNSIYNDLSNIKSMGANTMRFWGAPRYCYDALRTIGDLYFIQTIWIKGDEPDFQNASFKQRTKDYIAEVIDRVYAAFPDNNPPIIAFMIGNELSELSILSTDSAHPEITSYSGTHIKTGEGITASEAFIAEMADFARTYENYTYGRKTLLTYANEIRTYDIIDIPFLDFVSHNAYSYAVPYYRPWTAQGSTTGNVFQGWIEEVKAKHPDVPLLISETGLSVSPNAQQQGAPNYGYGGNSELEQRAGLLQNLKDIESTSIPLAGVCIHEYLDAWWKFGLEDSFTQDPDDIEEWFGIARLKSEGNWYTTEKRPVYDAIQNKWR